MSVLTSRPENQAKREKFGSVATVTVGQIPKPSGTGGRELLARRFRL